MDLVKKRRLNENGTKILFPLCIRLIVLQIYSASSELSKFEFEFE